MNKTDLIAKVAETAGCTKTNAEKAVNAIFGSQTVNGAIANALASGDKVQLVGFGTFEVRARGARKGRNPQTGQEIDIVAKNVPAFKSGTYLDEAIPQPK